MNCPVCSTAINDDAKMCSHCQSDLEIFNLIVNANTQRQTHRKIISALSVFAAVTAIGWASAGIFSGKAPEEVSPAITVQNEVRTPADSELIASLTAENASLKSENASLTEKINTVKEKPAAVVKEKIVAKEKASSKNTAEVATSTDESGTIIHTVRSGDTFWIIARKYFHDGRKYKQIAKDNGMSVRKKLHKGQKIKINK